jgi:hypothetical protein
MHESEEYKRLTASLQDRLRAHGARLPSLEPGQKWPRTGNKKSEGTTTPEGGNNIMNENIQNQPQQNNNVTPAGGEAHKKIADGTLQLLERIGKSVESASKQPETVSATAAKAAIVGGTVILTTAVVVGIATVVSNRWGSGAQFRKANELGARFNELAEQGKFMNMPLTSS